VTRKPAITRDGRSYRFQITANEFRHPRCFAVIGGGIQRVAAASVLDAAEAWFNLVAQSTDGAVGPDGVRGTMLRMVGASAIAHVASTRRGLDAPVAQDTAEADAAVDDIMASFAGG